MLHSTRSVFCIVAFFILVLSTLSACRKKSTESPINGSHVKVKLLNKDCMGYILAILDPRYASWGQSDYRISNETYLGAVWVQQGDQLFADLVVGEEYLVDMGSAETMNLGYCKRAPGPPDKAVSVYKVH